MLRDSLHWHKLTADIRDLKLVRLAAIDQLVFDPLFTQGIELFYRNLKWYHLLYDKEPNGITREIDQPGKINTEEDRRNEECKNEHFGDNAVTQCSIGL